MCMLFRAHMHALAPIPWIPRMERRRSQSCVKEDVTDGTFTVPEKRRAKERHSIGTFTQPVWEFARPPLLTGIAWVNFLSGPQLPPQLLPSGFPFFITISLGCRSLGRLILLRRASTA